MADIKTGKTIYDNPLASPEDIAGWRLEGDGAITFPQGRMRMENLRSPEEGQAANIVHWCDTDFPDHVAISWDVWHLREPGLCILFFSARGCKGEDIFDPSLATREGIYKQYTFGDINALHISYFRRKAAGERAFQNCNLRKSEGFHLVCQGADPLPCVHDATPPYRIQVVKSGPHVVFSINDLELFHWVDPGDEFGPVLEGGKIGFRQMAPLMAEYANLTVQEVEPL